MIVDAVHVIVPFRGVGTSKRRLEPLGDEWRQALSVAMLTDTISTVLAVDSQIEGHVVTGDPKLPRLIADVPSDVSWHLDPGGGLNAALHATLRRLGPTARRVVVLGDLPCLLASDLRSFLDDTANVPIGLVADARARGTTMWALNAGSTARPRFGRGSLAAHLSDGAVCIAASRRARMDVDHPIDLVDAHQLGLGMATAQVVHAMVDALGAMSLYEVVSRTSVVGHLQRGTPERGGQHSGEGLPDRYSRAPHSRKLHCDEAPHCG